VGTEQYPKTSEKTMEPKMNWAATEYMRYVDIKKIFGNIVFTTAPLPNAWTRRMARSPMTVRGIDWCSMVKILNKNVWRWGMWPDWLWPMIKNL
jgi:hypothetical protein